MALNVRVKLSKMCQLSGYRGNIYVVLSRHLLIASNDDI